MRLQGNPGISPAMKLRAGAVSGEEVIKVHTKFTR